MSVQWWVEGKRVSFREAMEARARGKCPSATVDATDGWPEIVAHVENDGHVAIEAMDLQIFRLPGMFRADALLRDIDAERGKSEEEKGQHDRRQQGEPAPVIETDGHAFTCLCGVSLHVPAKSRDMAKVEAEMRGWRCTRDNEMAKVWRCPSCATPSRDSTPDYYRIPRDAVQLWDVIPTLGMTHCHASAFEYVYRAGRKPGVSKADDLRKAVANLEYEIARLEVSSGLIVDCHRCGDTIEVCEQTNLGDNQLRAAGWGQTALGHDYGLWCCPECLKAALDEELEAGQ